MRKILYLFFFIIITNYQNIFPQNIYNFNPVFLPKDSLLLWKFDAEKTSFNSTKSLQLDSNSTHYKISQGWVNIVHEGFDGNVDPSIQVGYNKGSAQAYWGGVDCKSHSEKYSAFCARSGADGVLCGENYPPNMISLMRYGPFSLKNAIDGKLSLWYWMETASSSDYLEINFSTDGYQYWRWTGDVISGTSNNDFVEKVIDFKSLPFPIIGQSTIYIMIVFRSDGQGSSEGVFIDDFSINVLGNQENTMSLLKHRQNLEAH